MASRGALETILVAETTVVITLMAFTTYFFVQRPILHYVREIYFINSRRFRQAWYLVISATTFFLIDQAGSLFGRAGLIVPPEQADAYTMISRLSFVTLMVFAFTLVFSIFVRYVRHLPANETEIKNQIADDLRRSVLEGDRKVQIKLDLSGVGDVYSERRRLGPHVSLTHYRALMLGFVAYMEQRLGQMGDAILYAVGRLTAERAMRDLLQETPNKDQAVQRMLKEMEASGIGIASITQQTPTHVDVVIHENAPAAGIPPRGSPVCHFQAGTLAGIFDALTKKPVVAREVKCWGLGDRLCEFRIDILDG